jgi:ABC-2 type transport system permease protein
MTATAPPSTAQHGAAAGAGARPPLHRLALVELRKMTDTRAGFWLLVTTFLIAGAGLTLMASFAPPDERTLAGFFRAALDITGLIAPVLGILVVTSEWSQRTALTTFALVPRRGRVIGAKALAVVSFAVVLALVCLQLAVVAALLSPGDDAWDLSLGAFATGVLLQTLGVTGGFAIGLALLRSAPAIVFAYVLPIAFAILGEAIPGFRDTADWLDTTAPAEALWDDTGDGTAWAQLLTSWTLWLGVPLAIGLARVRRAEVA